MFLYGEGFGLIPLSYPHNIAGLSPKTRRITRGIPATESLHLMWAPSHNVGRGNNVSQTRWIESMIVGRRAHIIASLTRSIASRYS